jgi:HipA-like protein
MLNSIINTWKSIVRGQGEAPKTLQEPQAPTQDAHFKLIWEDLLIGELYSHQGNWHFSYSEEFRHQNKLQALANFPRKDQVYDSDELWPFFHARIPTANQPMVERELKRTRQPFSTNDEVEMLRRFGRRTVSNPYVLVPA